MAENREGMISKGNWGSCAQEEGNGCGWPTVDVRYTQNCASSFCLRQIIDIALD